MTALGSWKDVKIMQWMLWPALMLVSTVKADEGDWEVLFDGSDLSKWILYPDLSRDKEGDLGLWKVEGKELVYAPGKKRRGDIATRKAYRDFELKLEWRIGEKGNSGIIVRSEPGERPWFSGAELQILDTLGFGEKANLMTASGSVYAVSPVPKSYQPKKAEEWNEVHLIMKGNTMKYYLNGTLVQDLDFSSAEIQAIIKKSKFKKYPQFMAKPEGHLVLQDHNSPVRFRNIRLKELK